MHSVHAATHLVMEPAPLTSVVTITLKMLAICIGTALGTLGLVKESIDHETKRVTRWGRIALAGVIISGVVGVLAQGFESYTAAKSEKELLGTLHTQVTNQQATLNSQAAVLENINRGLYPFSSDTTIRTRLEIPLDQPFVAQYAEILRAAARQQHAKVIPIDHGDPLAYDAVPEARGFQAAMRSVSLLVAFRRDHDFNPMNEDGHVAFRIWPEWTAAYLVLPRRTVIKETPMSRAFYSADRDKIVLEAANWPPEWLQHDGRFTSLLDFRKAFVAARAASSGEGIRVNIEEIGIADRTGRCMYMTGFHVDPSGTFKLRLPTEEVEFWRFPV